MERKQRNQQLDLTDDSNDVSVASSQYNGETANESDDDGAKPVIPI